MSRVESLPQAQSRLAWRSWLPGLSSLQGWLLPAMLLAVLESVVRIGWIPAYLMPAPSELAVTLWELAEGPLWTHILASSLRVLAGFAIGASLALVLGSLVGLSRRLEAYLDPTFQALRAVPGLAWVPLLLIWLGIDESSKVTLIAIGSFFPVYLNLVAGIRNVDRKLVEVGELCNLSRLATIRRIFVPAAQPYLFTGLRAGLSMAWLCVVAAELLAATEGIGYLLTDGREVSRPDLVLVAIATLAVMGKLSDSLLKGLETRALTWRDNYDGDKR
ncbi:ABC transporter permease [Ectopseudomonas mendocina]|jgi:sulfonate transport system permease protein|uniref:ABC transporter permease n=1 Tax=Ectopseudomonas mendocina S5.2 TaxID=1225174 RepID=A0ABM5VRM2_ECTME|nr:MULTISPECIES: ABC transporter permease [Pseudomonas]ALN17344.1 ABC transporter permease [Pseudomonas mendocina S5.2]MDF2076028.1 ABC transporter permease [Pseudomonas mendocina]TRO40494.1 ABC transporter permease [Pseudomonas sp. ALS1131]